MIVPMAKDGKDPVGAMGADAPLAILSDKPQLLYSYFKQNVRTSNKSSNRLHS